MQRIIHRRNHAVWSAAATKRIEATATTQLAPHTLMQRAGLAIARLAQALAPHAQTIWVACGKGNNGGDGLEAAAHLQNWGRKVVVTWLGNSEECSADTHQAWAKAQAAGVQWAAAAPHAPPEARIGNTAAVRKKADANQKAVAPEGSCAIMRGP